MATNQDINKKAFEEIALVHMDALYSTALRMTRNAEEAEDLVQDTYLRAFRFFEKFQQGTNFRAWIFKILTNTFINNYRKKTRSPQQVDLEKVSFALESDQEYEGPDTWIPEYDEAAFEDMFDDDIQYALDKLSDEFRMIILLADIQGLSYKEISKIAGIPIGTVMSRLFRGRRMLQRSLGRYAKREGYIDENAPIF
ncbi:sigma-70 family RNA polymerase sigma factor [candidate division KSB1 bacterium]|nr:sigma-70 family RNA polymerase sigma factor [candidate division KSB1 bacterium]